MKKNLIFQLTLILLLTTRIFASDSLVINSPDKAIQMVVKLKGQLSYSVKFMGKFVILPSEIDMELAGGQ